MPWSVFRDIPFPETIADLVRTCARATASADSELRFLSIAGADTWPVRSLAFTPDGNTLFSAQQCLLRVWDVAGNQLRERVKPRGHTDAVTSLDLSPDCRTLASSGSDGRVVLWDLARETPASRYTLQGDGQVRFAPDGKSLVAGFKKPLLWDLIGKAPRLAARLGQFRSGPAGLAFSADGKRFASDSVTPVLRLWDLGGKAPRMHLELFEKGSGGGVESLALSPDGRLLAGGRQWGRDLRVWRIRAARVEEIAVPRAKAFRVAFSRWQDPGVDRRGAEHPPLGFDQSGAGRAVGPEGARCRFHAGGARLCLLSRWAPSGVRGARWPAPGLGDTDSLQGGG